MTRRVYFDIESTGVDPAKDRIVEICLHTPCEESVKHRVNPGVPIPAGATEVHGISDDDVRDLPPFRSVAEQVQRCIDGAVLVGFNIRRFDSIMLDSELRRVGQPGLARDPHGKICQPELDLYQIWMRSESRSLTGAAARFAGVELGDDAHSADADTFVLPAVLEGMVREFGLQEHDDQALCALCVPEGAVDRDGKFLRRGDGVVIYNFGPKKDEPISVDTGLLEWMLKKDFSEDTKAVARELLSEIRRPRRREVSANGDLFGSREERKPVAVPSRGPSPERIDEDDLDLPF